LSHWSWYGLSLEVQVLSPGLGFKSRVLVNIPGFISERELMFMFAIMSSSVRLSVCRLSVVYLSSVTFVHPTQPIEIFGNVSALCNTLVT